MTSCKLEWSSLKNLETTDAGEDVEKQEHFYIVDESVNQFNLVRDSVKIPQGSRNSNSFWPSNPITVYIPKEYKSFYYKDTCTHMFIAAQFTIAKTWNQPKCSSMIDWKRKMQHIYTMEYYATIKNDKFVCFVETWMNLETIILSKLTQEKKTKYHVFTHRWVTNSENTWAQGREQHSLGQVGRWRAGEGREGEGQQGWGRWGGIAWGEMPNVGEGEKKSNAHCHVCTYATVLHALLMYPKTYNPIKNLKKNK